MESDRKYKIGDPVWSKMRGYIPWPSRIAAPYESSLENKTPAKAKHIPSYLVYFFGSNNFAWMPEDTIKPYEEFKDKNKNGGKQPSFKQGVKLIEEYCNTGGQEKLLDEYKKWEEEKEAAIKNDISSNSNNDLDDNSSHDGGDSLNEDSTNGK